MLGPADADGHDLDLAQPAAPDDLGRLAEIAEDVGPLLAAGLEDAVVLPGRVDAPLALGQRQRERLLAVDVLARLHRLDRRDRVPVLGRGDADRVDVLAADQLAEVGVRGAALVRPSCPLYAFSTRRLACSRRFRSTSQTASAWTSPKPSSSGRW